MEIEIGTQPNCSELVIRLGDRTEEEIKDELRSIGIEEWLIRSDYASKPKPTEWDGQMQVITAIKATDMGKELREAWDNLHSEKKKIYEKAAKFLIKNYGIERFDYSMYFIDNGGEKTTSYGIWIGDEPYDDGGKAIWYHQHCQPQGFPTLRKISHYFGASVEAHDGGGIETYEEWLEENDSEGNNE